MSVQTSTGGRPAGTEDLIVIAGAGGFIGGSLVRYFHDRGYSQDPGGRQEAAVRMVPTHPRRREPLPGFERTAELRPGLRRRRRGLQPGRRHGRHGLHRDAFRVECLRSILINTHMLEAASGRGVERYFYSSSACVYNTDLQKDPDVRALKESDAYPAMAEDGYGWEKLVQRDVLPGIFGRSAASRPASPGSTTSTAPTAPGTAAAKRRRPPSAARSSRPRTGTDEIEIWGDGSRPAASCTSTTASRAST